MCGGGRYDGLVEMLGGPKTPALGFGMGLERLLLVMEKSGCPFPERAGCNIYIGSMGEKASIKAAQLTTMLRREGFNAQSDVVGRSVKAQMKYADKIAAEYSCIIGDNELDEGVVKVKKMATGEEFKVSLNESVGDIPDMLSFVYDSVMHTAMLNMNSAVESFGNIE